MPLTYRPDEVILRIDVFRLESGMYELVISYGSEVLLSEVAFGSITEALISATGMTGPIRGFEVAYENLVVGTYLVEHLHTTAAAVADEAVWLHGAFRD